MMGFTGTRGLPDNLAPRVAYASPRRGSLRRGARSSAPWRFGDVARNQAGAERKQGGVAGELVVDDCAAVVAG